MPICFGTGLHVSAISIVRHFTVSLGHVLYCISSFHNANLEPRNVQFIVFAQASFIAQDACSQTYDPIWSSRIGHQMRYREPKKLVFGGV